MNICDLRAYGFCVSWLRPPEDTEGLCTPFPDVKGLGTRQAHATGGSGGRSPPAAGGHGSKRLLHGTGWAASFVLYCDCLRPVLMSLGSLCSRNASWSP